MKGTLIGLFALVALLVSSAGFAGETGKGTVNINTASVEELMELQGIGKSKAEAIVAYRQAHPFKAIEELLEVKGIGPRIMEKLQGQLTLDGVEPLPSATR